MTKREKLHMAYLLSDSSFFRALRGIRRVVRSVENVFISIGDLFYWLPVIWKDRFWDYTFLLRIIAHKLDYDAKRYERGGHLISSGRNAKRMRICSLLLKRVADNGYCNRGKDGYSSPNLWWGNRTLDYEDYMIDQDLQLFVKLFTKHIRQWWD